MTSNHSDMQQTANDVDQVKVATQQTAADVDQMNAVVQETATDVDQLKRLLSSNLITADYGALPILSGSQLRESIRKWLSSPDPSTNHNIACGTHNKKTATWFFQDSIFQEWKSTASLLWIHGKRLSCLLSNSTPSDSILYSSWLGEKCYLVREVSKLLSEVTDVSCQFHVDSRYRSHVQDRKCIEGLFLF